MGIVMVCLCLGLLTAYGISSLQSSYYAGEVVRQEITHTQYHYATQGLLNYVVACASDRFQELIDEAGVTQYTCDRWPVDGHSQEYKGVARVTAQDTKLLVEVTLVKGDCIVARQQCQVAWYKQGDAGYTRIENWQQL